MEQTELHDRLVRVVRTLFNNDQIVLTDETVPADVPGWDSLANINLMFAIEQEFGVEFADEEFTGSRNVGELKAQLARKRSD
jgi:acyl carrier protein